MPGWMLVGGIGVFLLSTCAAMTLAGLLVVGAGRVPPGVSALGVNLSLMARTDAAAALDSALGEVLLRDGQRVWTVNAAELGIMLDAESTVQRAAEVGISGLFGGVSVAPVVSINTETLTTALNQLASQVELPPRNAGIRLLNGQVEAVPAANGRQLDVSATAAQIASDPARALIDGSLDLVMGDVVPAIADASPLVEQARGLLASPLRIQAYDPFSDETLAWTIQPTEWAAWITAEPDPSSSIGLRLTLSRNDVSNFLSERAEATLPSHQTIDLEDATQTVIDAVAAYNTIPVIRVRELDRTHTVRSGESITSIAWDYGIPYPYIQEANPNVGGLNAGQTLTIPSREVFLEYDPVSNKRIVVSISGNWTRVYENGSLKWDWVSSTGINDSPTWPGVYQIITHEENAYAGNWNLYMPWFLGVYKPIPGSGFTNGFHGFPTRGGGQILWENSLGTRVTYGCILISNTNAKLLYDWAEDGVVVEILP
jgi:lipoprotein-anchoring transpeptidase ErfK/SrfK